MPTEFINTSLFNDADLVAYYKLENTEDSKGSNTLTNNGSVDFTASKFNNGADLGIANTTKFLSTTTDLGIAGNQSISVSLWVKATAAPALNASCMFATHSSIVGADKYIQLYYQNSAGILQVTLDPAGVPGIYTITLDPAVWYHFVFMRNVSNSTATVYMNGVLIISTTVTTGTSGNTRFQIGKGNTSFFNGYIDDVAVFSRVLTPDEIIAVYEGRSYVKNLSTITAIQSISFSHHIYVLDEYSGAQAAFSLRHLTRSATKCIRVRRSSDNTEQDIGFTGGGLLDTPALTDFVGVNDGFVVTWYDQSGNFLDATQATTGSQPKIVTAGVVYTSSTNGKHALSFNGSKFLTTPNSSGWTDANGLWQGYTVATYNSYGLRCTWIVDSGSGAGRVLWFSGSESLQPQSIAWNSAGTNFNDRTTAPATGIPILIYSIRRAADVEVFAQNVSNGALTTTGTPRVASSNPSEIGRYGGGGFVHDGDIQELFCFPNNTDNRAAISALLNSYYTLY